MYIYLTLPHGGIRGREVVLERLSSQATHITELTVVKRKT